MSPGLAAFFAVMAVLTACYAAFAPTHEIVMDDTVYTDDRNGLFNKWFRPAVRNILPVTPNFVISYARGSSTTSGLLLRSGNPWNVTPEELIILRIMSAFVTAAAISVYAALGFFPLPPIFLFLGGLVFGWMIPQLLLSTVWGKRKKELTRTIPEALDLLRVCMNAGMNFDKSLPEVVVLLPEGATRTELHRVVMDINSGKTVERSMNDFARRTPISQVESFVKAVNVSVMMGTDVAATLASQADESRAQYERAVEIKAQKLQTTLFIPIIALFLPSLLILIFGPSLADLGNML